LVWCSHRRGNTRLYLLYLGVRAGLAGYEEDGGGRVSKFLGIYEMGWNKVEIRYATAETGGSFTIIPNGKNRVPMIEVGLNHNRWKYVLDALIHEAMEFALFRANARFESSQTTTGDHSKYLFCFNHPVFSDCCAIVSELVTTCQTDLFKVWKAEKRKKGKK
jgi:hypothetical protein